MRRHHGSDAARTGNRFSGETVAFIASLAAVTLAVAASAASVYVLLAIVTSAGVVPRSADDWRVLGSLSLVIGGFAVVMATRDELHARRRGISETPEGLSGASRTLTASRSRARPEPSR
jgi:hypothetical protein